MQERDWQPLDGGATLGQSGSEGGTIVLDDEHASGARITLERDTAHSVPFAITCGVYGWMVHTRFFSDRQTAQAAVDAMKPDLAALAAEPTADGCRDLVERYP